MNFVHKLSESINFYQMFLTHEQNAQNQLRMTKYILSAIALLLIFILDSLLCSRKGPHHARTHSGSGKPDSKKRRAEKVD